LLQKILNALIIKKKIAAVYLAERKTQHANIPTFEELNRMMFFHVMTAFCTVKDSPEGLIEVTAPRGT